MNPFKSFKLMWWKAGLLKLSMLRLGLAGGPRWLAGGAAGPVPGSGVLSQLRLSEADVAGHHGELHSMDTPSPWA
jgi:hypothetical protein